MMKKLFSATETKYQNNMHESIELVSCPLKEMMCKVHLSAVNSSFMQSEQYRREKDFPKSIEKLKSAFYKAAELMDHPCTKCAQHYRSNIIESLEKIHDELEDISSGIFGSKKYQSSYIEAVNTLKEFENARLDSKIQLNESKGRFLGNYLN